MADRPPVNTHVAAHVGGLFRTMIRDCERALASDAVVTHLAHYSQGLHNFSVDRLGTDESRRREELVALGRTLSLLHAGFDRTLRDVRTGALVRTVLHSMQGAAICVVIQPGDLLVGVVSAQEDGGPLSEVARVRSADVTASRLAVGLRAQTRQSSYNPGGWETVDDQLAPFVTAATEPAVSVRVPAGRGVDRARAALAETLRRGDVHFVAYHVDGQVAVSGDTFGAPELEVFFTQITVDARRRFYLSFTRELATSLTSLNRSVTPVPGGRLLRLVLDVEQGAVYYYRLDSRRYLVGVTLDQGRMPQADLDMAVLAARMLADD